MFEVRPALNADEFGRAVDAIGLYFGAPVTEERIDRFKQVLPFDRMHAAFENGEIVGGAGAYPFELSVPGNVLRCGGVSVVGVYPMHRRRGVLRAMMDAQLRDIHEREEPIASLWASEETIYGRYGYGLAAWCGAVNLQRQWNAYSQPFERRGRVRFVTPEEAAQLFPPVWDALMRERTGVFQRTKAWWELRRLRIRDEEKANPKHLVVLELDGSVQAYAIYRQLPNFEDGSPNARLEVSEVVGTTPQATAEIWRFVLDVDLYGTLECSLLPVDHALFTLLANPRRARYRMGDSLWMRLVDVGAALSGREYAADGASSSRCAMLCARGTRAAGSSRAAPLREPMRPQISRSTSASSALRISALSRSPSCARVFASRSSPTGRYSGRTRSSNGGRCPGAPRSSELPWLAWGG